MVSVVDEYEIRNILLGKEKIAKIYSRGEETRIISMRLS